MSMSTFGVVITGRDNAAKNTMREIATRLDSESETREIRAHSDQGQTWFSVTPSLGVAFDRPLAIRAEALLAKAGLR